MPTEPSVSQKALTYDKMSRLTGTAFDRAFIKMMIADHKTDIPRFRNEAKKKNDPAADFANQMLPTLEEASRRGAAARTGNMKPTQPRV